MSETDPLGLVGQTIDDLRFDECVDREGRGLVYRGHLKGRDEPVAIKCLSLSRLGATDVSQRAAVAARFNEETKILKRLADGTHDIVHCYASGMLSAPTTGETVQYQVLEWLNGRTLRVDLAERRERGMPGRPLRETLDMMESAALALAHAHSQGIVHRDVQPANLMLVRGGAGFRLKVLDFGLAKILGRDAPIGSDVLTNVSPDYAAPEQLAKPPGDIGPWTDVYSLALVVLEVMRGTPIPNSEKGAVRASSFGVLLPTAVEELFLSATAADPFARPQDAGTFWRHVRELATAAPVANQDALAATALDAKEQAAIQRIRAMTAPQSDKGTMLMPGAPMHAHPASSPEMPVVKPSPLAASVQTVKPSMRGGTAPMPAAPGPIAPRRDPVPAPTPTPSANNLVAMAPAPAEKSPALVIGILAAVVVVVIVVALVLILRR